MPYFISFIFSYAFYIYVRGYYADENWSWGFEGFTRIEHLNTKSSFWYFVCLSICLSMWVSLVHEWFGQIMFSLDILCPVNKYIIAPKLGAFQMNPNTKCRLSLKRVFFILIKFMKLMAIICLNKHSIAVILRKIVVSSLDA